MGGLAKPREQSNQQAGDIHSKSVTRQGQTRRSERRKGWRRVDAHRTSVGV